jgi:lysophospholipase L1-like esterase
VTSRLRVIVLLSAFLASWGAPACSDSPTAPSAVTVVAFGDSLTTGVGTTGDNDFVSLLANRTGVPIVNAGRSGDTTASALARIDSAVLSRDADIAIVLLGGNDLLQGVPVQQRVANITSIVQQIRADGAAVILVGVASGSLDPFEGALPGIASQTSSTLVPAILDGIIGVSGLMSDLVHPNNAGHAIMADRIEPSLRAALAAAGS